MIFTSILGTQYSILGLIELAVLPATSGSVVGHRRRRMNRAPQEPTFWYTW